jgi:hypothetical protein
MWNVYEGRWGKRFLARFTSEKHAKQYATLIGGTTHIEFESSEFISY